MPEPSPRLSDGRLSIDHWDSVLPPREGRQARMTTSQETCLMLFDYLRSGYAVKMKAVFGQASSYPKIYELGVIVTNAAFIPFGGSQK
jgi:hypothetical protein